MSFLTMFVKSSYIVVPAPSAGSSVHKPRLPERRDAFCFLCPKQGPLVMPSGAGLGLTKILCRRGFSVPESEEGNRELFPTARGKWAGGGKGGLSG